MVRLVGIDEAGLGPVLGPLVVTAVSLEVPDELVATDLWEILAGVVGRRPADGAPLAIADSKRLYHGARNPRGLAHLERGVLAALGCYAPLPADLTQLRAVVAAGATHPPPEPWDDGIPLLLPLALPVAEVDRLAGALREGLAAAGIRLLDIRADEVRPARLNRLLAHHGSKAEVVFTLVARLLERVLAAPGGATVHVDRLGGRRHYLAHLQRLQAVSRVWTLAEERSRSSYRVETPRGASEIHFEVGGDRNRLPVALASMVSKYLRELAMTLFNRFWCERVPGLHPTAGYPADGARFLAAIEPTRRRLGIALEILKRDR